MTLAEGATAAVIASMADEDSASDWWDPRFGEDTGLDFFSGDWWLGPAEAAQRRISTKITDFDPSGWETQYENGRIPLPAMVRVGTEANGAAAYLRPDAAASWMAMGAAAAQDGVTLTLTDSYRTFEQQASFADPKSPSYNPNAVKIAGTSNHGWGIAVDVGEGAQREWMAANGARFGWHVLDGEPWHFDFGSDASETIDMSAVDGAFTTKGNRTPLDRVEPVDISLVPLIAAGSQNLTDAIFALYSIGRIDARGRDDAPTFTGDQATAKRQLWQGFMDADRPDLAKMVRTKDFDTWIGAESGWRVDVVSKYYSGHGRNAGLFQFALLDRDWVWGDVNTSDWTYAATAYQQALYVAKYFSHLTPEAIRTYADQIRSGTYHGWG